MRKWLILLGMLACCAFSGCTPRHYRLNADAETYAIVAQKTQCPPWHIPPFSIEAPPESRNFDPFDPDQPPLPPDDPAAHAYMHCADGKHGYLHWHKRGDAPWIEDGSWLQFLQWNEDGQLKLDRDGAVELGLLNSREYLFELEQLYLAALALSLERFEFRLQWFGGKVTDYTHFGSSSTPGETNTLTTSSNLGFTRSLAAGGELLVDFANTFVWEFTGANSHSTLSNIGVSFVQPLLRGAFRDVRMEALTQDERQVLYEARDFARFRKQFYFDIVSGDDGYLSLLLRLQAIRNLEANLESLQQNLKAHEVLAEAGIVSPLQVDQVFQSYQAGRLALIQARNGRETALDTYKIGLGLPPEMDVQLDDSLLSQFELNSPEMVQLGQQFEELLVLFRERDEPPTRQRILRGFDELKSLHQRLVAELETVLAEFEQWTAQAEDAESQQVDEEREREAQEVLTERLSELKKDLETAGRQLDAAAQKASDQPLEAAWESIQARARQESAHRSDLFIIQTQVRVYLIELPPVELEREDPIALGVANRLDLMNQRAQVVDAWRKSHVAADGLESDLDAFFEADIATSPGGKNPVKFSASDSRYRVGLRFDGPLNRMVERNIYREELVNYQRARRDYIATRDGIVRAIRLDLRNLEAGRLNFEIARQSLVVAARQVELAQIQLLAPGQAGDSSTTQDVLQALNDLLDAQNGLIAIWVAYETDRLQLLLDTEALQLDQRGIYRDDDPHAGDRRELLDPPSGEPIAGPADPS